jgi:hypothetical protein
MWKEMHRLNPRVNNITLGFKKGIGPILFLLLGQEKILFKCGSTPKKIMEICQITMEREGITLDHNTHMLNWLWHNFWLMVNNHP